MKMKGYKKSQKILDTMIRKYIYNLRPEDLGMVVQKLGTPFGPNGDCDSGKCRYVKPEGN